MIGDVYIWLRRFFKESFCIHNYVEHYRHSYPPVYYNECEKCGRVK